jgi:hypothetical protein
VAAVAVVGLAGLAVATRTKVDAARCSQVNPSILTAVVGAVVPPVTADGETAVKVAALAAMAVVPYFLASIPAELSQVLRAVVTEALQRRSSD